MQAACEEGVSMPKMALSLSALAHKLRTRSSSPWWKHGLRVRPYFAASMWDAYREIFPGIVLRSIIFFESRKYCGYQPFFKLARIFKTALSSLDEDKSTLSAIIQPHPGIWASFTTTGIRLTRPESVLPVKWARLIECVFNLSTEHF